MIFRVCALCVMLIPCAAICFLSSAAQDGGKTTPAITTKVQSVLLDVVVTDDKGDSVTGLSQEEFEVQEDGARQTITSFEEHLGVASTEVTLPPMPPHVFTNFPVLQTADAVDVLLLDALNTPSRDQVYVHSQMLKYLRSIPPGTRVAIFTLASRLRMLQGVTTDSAELLAALHSKTAAPQSSPLLPSQAENDANERFVDFLEENAQGAGPTSRNAAAVDPIQAAKQFLAETNLVQTEMRIDITLEALEELARYLATVPGRKNLIWLSGAFPVNVFPDPEIPDSFTIAASFDAEVRKTADLMSASQMAVYPIAAEGLLSDEFYEADAKEIGEKRPSIQVHDRVQQMRHGQLNRDLNHQAMEELAKDTGGRAFYNTNGLNDAISRVVNNGMRYYSISYVPTHAAIDGKFRHIQVKLGTGKYTLAYRRGYYADDYHATLATSKNADDPLLPLLGRNLPEYSQILYKVLVQRSNPQPAAGAARAGSNSSLKGPVTRYSVDFAIASHDLNFQSSPDGSRHGHIEVAMIAYDREGKPLNFVVSNGDYLVRPDVYPNLQKVGLQVHKEIDVPGPYAFLRTGVYDQSTGAAGTLGVPLAEPAPVEGK